MKKEIVAVILGLTFYALTANAQLTVSPLSQDDIIALSKPAIVKIYHQVTGQFSIPAIKLDIKTMSLSLGQSSQVSTQATYSVSSDSVVSSQFNYTITADEGTAYGTGFIINPNGYIVTNDHVVSDKFFFA